MFLVSSLKKIELQIQESTGGYRDKEIFRSENTKETSTQKVTKFP